jgi:hypothetical protein
MRTNLLGQESPKVFAQQVADRSIATFRSSRGSVEEAADARAAVSSFFLKVIEADLNLVEQGDYIDPEKMSLLNQYLSTLAVLTEEAYSNLVAREKEFANVSDALDTALSSSLVKVNQKHSALKSLSSTAAQVVREGFKRRERLALTGAAEELALFSRQGVATLPIESEAIVSISKMSIARGSNGINGNSDRKVLPELGYLSSILDSNPDNHFEYESYKRGPLTLKLRVQLDRESIVNHLRFKFVNPESVPSFTVENILINDKNLGMMSVKELCPNRKEPDFWDAINEDGTGNWEVVFLPVIATEFTLVLKQTHANTEGRKAIGIGGMEVKGIRFKSSGKISSKPRGLASSLYYAERRARIFPPGERFYKADIKTEYEIDGTIARDIHGLSGEEQDMSWSCSLRRKEGAVSSAKTLLTKEELYEVDTLTRTINPNRSPALVPLNVDLEDTKLLVVQPNIAKVGERSEPVSLGRLNTGQYRVTTPTSILERDFDVSDLVVEVSGERYDYVQDTASLGTANWTFSELYKKIILSDDAPSGGEVTVRFKPEVPVWEKTPNGYACNPSFLFDPDKKLISISLTDELNASKVFNLPRNQEVIRLPHKHINRDSAQLVGSDGVVLELVDTVAELASGKWYLDESIGVVKLYESSGLLALTLHYSCSPRTEVRKEQYSVLFEGVTPKSLLVSSEAFNAFSVSERKGDELISRNNPVTGRWGARNDPYTGVSNKKRLSYESIIKGTLKTKNLFVVGEDAEEIPYINGYLEFLGATYSEEKTNQTAPVAGVVTFSLAGGSLTLKELGVRFSDTSVFVSQKALLGGLSSTGDYHISNSGVVSVKRPTALPADITVSYYYSNPRFVSSNKYSVDYRNGDIFSETDMRDEGIIRYKVCPSVIEYDIVKELTEAVYYDETNLLTVATEEMLPVNNKVKVFWKKTVNVDTLEDLAAYFSPIVTAITHRYY